MKILIASDLHWPTINGVATFSRNLAYGLAARGHEVLVIAPSQTCRRYEEYDRNHLVKRTMSVSFPFYQNFKISPSAQLEVKKIIDEFEPDVIHIQMLMWIGQAAMKYGNRLGVPIVSTNHAMPENLLDNLRLLAPLAKPISYMLTEYGRRFHSKSDYITMPTQSAIDMFDVNDKVEVPMVAISNGIDLSRFTPTQAPDELYAKYRIPTDKPVIGYVGRLDAEKHLQVLVRAFSQVLESVDAHLMIVGGGTDSERLENLVYDLKIHDNVSFTGRVSDEELVDLHKIPTVFAMPSPAELQSIATLEAMASGQPVVAVDAGALKELCQNERNGFLCETDNDWQMAEGLKSVINDKKLRKKMSDESLSIAAEHDMNYTLDKFEEVYRGLVK
jgi:glycosyltransferase involved in cell wall biosynthesis